jgi:predicted ATPase
MLTTLRIRNFKSWKDTGTVRLAPLTVFFGVNSAGKTSLLQFLLMLKQTSESQDQRRVVHPGDDYTPVELGTFQDLIFDHDLNNKLEFEFSWTLPKPLAIADRLKRKSTDTDTLRFAASIASVADVQYVEWFEYSSSPPEKPRINVHLSAKGNPPNQKYELSARGFDLVRTLGRAWPLQSPIHFYGFPNEVAAYYQNAGFTSVLALALERQLKRLMYLGPMRDYPNRTYTWSGDVPEHVGRDGDGTVAALLAAANRKFNFKEKQPTQTFQRLIARWLKQLGLLDSFEARRIAPNRKEYEVRVKANDARKEVDLPDVGFGISQVLPVVVEAFYVAPDSTVIIEQPELHLHPRAQSELGDLFIDAIRAREGGTERRVQFLVESHSEHFLQRIQRRVAEGVLHPSDVALYFCEPRLEGSSLQELKVTLFGDIENWPQNFFGDPMLDLAARAEAASQREERGEKE